MPNFNGVWSLTTQAQYASDWPVAPDLALFGGGDSDTSIIERLLITSTGTATDFGTLSVARERLAGVGNTTRAVFAGGYAAGTGSDQSNVMDYSDYTTGGNASDFGDLTVARRGPAGNINSSTRGVFAAGGYPSSTDVNVIDYITIGSTGNATDFGDVTTGRGYPAGTCSSTRGIVGGGGTGTYVDIIDYITIGSTGNATDFGDLTLARASLAAAGSETRGIFASGVNNSQALVDTMDYVTIASTGNATDFGDLVQSVRDGQGVCNATKAIFADDGSTALYAVTIATTGDATTFGNLTTSQSLRGGASAGMAAVQ